MLERSPWRQLLQGSEPAPAPPAERAPLPDPTKGLIDWSPAVATSLDRFWSAERGVEEATQRRRHVAHAELDPKQRDLEYVRWAATSTLSPKSRQRLRHVAHLDLELKAAVARICQAGPQSQQSAGARGATGNCACPLQFCQSALEDLLFVGTEMWSLVLKS